MLRTTRRAHPSEYAIIASQHIAWVKRTPWYTDAPEILQARQSVGALAQWMHQEIDEQGKSSLWVTEYEGMIAGQCGVSLMEHILPPHMPYVFEWLWTCHDPRSGVLAWRAAEDWGRQHGALYSFRSIRQTSKGRSHREQIRWRYVS